MQNCNNSYWASLPDQKKSSPRNVSCIFAVKQFLDLAFSYTGKRLKLKETNVSAFMMSFLVERIRWNSRFTRGRSWRLCCRCVLARSGGELVIIHKWIHGGECWWTHITCIMLLLDSCSTINTLRIWWQNCKARKQTCKFKRLLSQTLGIGSRNLKNFSSVKHNILSPLGKKAPFMRDYWPTPLTIFSNYPRLHLYWSMKMLITKYQCDMMQIPQQT